jgi:hypothetical protein
MKEDNILVARDIPGTAHIFRVGRQFDLHPIHAVDTVDKEDEDEDERYLRR